MADTAGMTSAPKTAKTAEDSANRTIAEEKKARRRAMATGGSARRIKKARRFLRFVDGEFFFRKMISLFVDLVSFSLSLLFFSLSL